MMQRFYACLIVTFFLIPNLYAQGKFAGSYRSLVNKNYQDKSQLSLTGFAFQSGTFMGDLSVSWYRKGNLVVALFESISKNGYHVHDVLQLSNFSDSQSLRFANCLNARAIDDESIVALVTVAKGELLYAISAWRWNDEIKALEAIDKNEANGISCPAQPLVSGQLTSASWKPFVNKIYKDSKEIPALKDYTFREGTMLTGNNVSVSSYVKTGNTVLVFERLLEDNYRFVFDIIETTVTDSQDIRIGLCRKGKFDDGGLLAIVQKSDQERWQAVKAWLCDAYHLSVTEAPAKEVTCLGNYGEN